MIERLLEWQALNHVHYWALDSDPNLLDRAQERLTEWTHDNALGSEVSSDSLTITAPASTVEVRWVRADLEDYLSSSDNAEPYDLILAHQLVDLLPLRRDLPLIAAALRSGGCAYLTLNFDGLTAFEPVSDYALESEIVSAYHFSMDERDGPDAFERHSLTGRRMLHLLPRVGLEVLDAGPSDWVIHPGPDGYRAGERTVLEWMLDTIEQALRSQAQISSSDLARWVSERRGQLERHELILIVHQIDLLARKP